MRERGSFGLVALSTEFAFTVKSLTACSTLVQSHCAKPLWIGTNKGDDGRERTIEVVWWIVKSVTREKMDERGVQRSCSVRRLLSGIKMLGGLMADDVTK